MASHSQHKCKVELDGKSIEVLVTRKATEIDEWVRDLYTLLNSDFAVVGLCIQCKPNDNKHMTMRSKAATLQLCMDKKCLIIQLHLLDQIPESLKSFLTDPCLTFVGLRIDDDVKKLVDEYELKCRSVGGLHVLGRKIWPWKYKDNSEPSLADMAWSAESYFLQRIPVEIFMSNWEASVLNVGQIKYGCMYAYAFHKIGLKLLKSSWTSDCWFEDARPPSPPRQSQIFANPPPFSFPTFNQIK